MPDNTNKTKELVICFSKKVNVNDIPGLYIYGNDTESVTTLKLLDISRAVELTH